MDSFSTLNSFSQLKKHIDSGNEGLKLFYFTSANDNSSKKGLQKDIYKFMGKKYEKILDDLTKEDFSLEKLLYEFEEDLNIAKVESTLYFSLFRLYLFF